ncbi:hypothetical protein RUM43_015062 [Polyplax serrata]|uniref:Reverse transcriptase domain-containing protein n=1 Tax=Polyplax serrata TaxID=468196 RepID=A0AAN8S2E8_POLSC
MDGFLHEVRGHGSVSFAYADDRAILVPARCRPDLEQRVCQIMERFREWEDSAKMQISPRKTTAMFLKGPFFELQYHPLRIFHYPAGERRIRVQIAVKYLGVYVDTERTWTIHVIAQCSLVIPWRASATRRGAGGVTLARRCCDLRGPVSRDTCLCPFCVGVSSRAQDGGTRARPVAESSIVDDNVLLLYHLHRRSIRGGRSRKCSSYPSTPS